MWHHRRTLYLRVFPDVHGTMHIFLLLSVAYVAIVSLCNRGFNWAHATILQVFRCGDMDLLWTGYITALKVVNLWKYLLRHGPISAQVLDGQLLLKLFAFTRLPGRPRIKSLMRDLLAYRRVIEFKEAGDALLRRQPFANHLCLKRVLSILTLMVEVVGPADGLLRLVELARWLLDCGAYVIHFCPIPHTPRFSRPRCGFISQFRFMVDRERNVPPFGVWSLSWLTSTDAWLNCGHRTME